MILAFFYFFCFENVILMMPVLISAPKDSERDVQNRNPPLKTLFSSTLDNTCAGTQGLQRSPGSQMGPGTQGKIARLNHGVADPGRRDRILARTPSVTKFTSFFSK